MEKSSQHHAGVLSTSWNGDYELLKALTYQPKTGNNAISNAMGGYIMKLSKSELPEVKKMDEVCWKKYFGLFFNHKIRVVTWCPMSIVQGLKWVHVGMGEKENLSNWRITMSIPKFSCQNLFCQKCSKIYIHLPTRASWVEGWRFTFPDVSLEKC